MGRVIGKLLLALPLAGVVALLHFTGGTARAAGLISGNYQINWDQTVDKTDAGTADVRKFKQALDLKYKGLLSPVVRNEMTFKVEQEINSNAPDITRVLPALDLGFKGKYWDAKAGGKRTHENSDEPGKTPKVTEIYFLEFFYIAPKNIPDLKAKYTLDLDFQEGATDTRKQGVTLSSVYDPTKWLSTKGDYTRNRSDDRLNPDADTEDEKVTGTVGIRHMLSDKIKADTQYSVDISRGATLRSDGAGADPGSQKEDQGHAWKNTLSFRPFRDTSIDGSYDFNLKQNKVNGEHTITKNSKVSASQKIGRQYDIKGDFGRNITEARHTQDDNQKTEDTWTVDFKAKFSRQLDFTLKYQKKDTDEKHVDPTKNTTSESLIQSASWTGELAPFWKASATYDKTDTITREVKTTVDTKYGVKSTFDFKAIKLTLDPSYDITLKDDLVKPESTAIRDFKLKLAGKVFSTRTMETKIDHTYGRKTDSAAKNIQRTDSSSGNMTWTEPFPGWTFGFDVTRSATDTSEDDLPPDITSAFGFKADYKFEQLRMSTTYKYDKKSSAAESENFDAKIGWAAPKWDVSLTYTFKKTFSIALNEGYTISLTFKYNL
jgi:predicted porin